MMKRFAALAAGIVLAASVAVPLASASSLTTDQVNSIVSLLRAFGADATTIANVQVALTGTGTVTPPVQNCVTLSRDLFMGATGSDVTSLQNFLIAGGYLAAGYNTGYYGNLTYNAVGKMQTARGILAAGNGNSVTYGVVGSATRASISCTTPLPSSASFSATPTSGSAPLTVSFTGSGLTGGSQYVIDFGDGASNWPLAAIDNCMHLSDGSGGCPHVSASHTYTSVGTYTAILEPYVACMWTNPRCLVATQALGQVTISVSPQVPQY